MFDRETVHVVQFHVHRQQPITASSNAFLARSPAARMRLERSIAACAAGRRPRSTSRLGLLCCGLSEGAEWLAALGGLAANAVLPRRRCKRHRRE